MDELLVGIVEDDQGHVSVKGIGEWATMLFILPFEHPHMATMLFISS